MTHDITHTTILTDSLLVRHVVPLLVVYRIMMHDMIHMIHDMTHTTILTDSLLVSHVVPLLVVLAVGRVDKRQAAVSTLLAAGLGLVLQEMTIVRLGLPPPLGHELHVEHLKAVQAQDVLRTVVLLQSKTT